MGLLKLLTSPFFPKIGERRSRGAESVESAPLEPPPVFVSPFDRPFFPVGLKPVAELVKSFGFSGSEYKARYPDLQGFTDDDVLAHYLMHGITESRDAGVAYCRENFAEYLAAFKALDIADQARHAFLTEHFLGEYLRKVVGFHGTFPEFDALSPTDLETIFALKPHGLFPVLVIGDSHSVQYMQVITKDGQTYFPLRLACIGGTARGLSNPSSNLGFGERIATLISATDSLLKRYHVPIIFKFGQVDIEFVYNMRRAARNETTWDQSDFEEFARQSVERYLRFLQDIIEPYADIVYVCSVNAPVLSNEAWAEGYLKAHFQLELTGEQDCHAETFEAIKTLEMPSLKDRTSGHAYFNRLLKRGVTKCGFEFFDDFKPFINRRTGVISTSYIAETRGTDCHIDWRPSSKKMMSIIGSLMG